MFVLVTYLCDTPNGQQMGTLSWHGTVKPREEEACSDEREPNLTLVIHRHVYYTKDSVNTICAEKYVKYNEYVRKVDGNSEVWLPANAKIQTDRHANKSS